MRIEYDGTNFVGWQSQKNGDSVQDNIEKVLILPEFTERGLIIKKCLTGRGWSVVR